MAEIRPISQRSKIRINTDWHFVIDDTPGTGAEGPVDASWEAVTLPHTLALTSLNLDDCEDDKMQSTFHRHIGWYRRTIDIGADHNQLVFLEFEGAHQITDLWINGVHAGCNDIGGYTPFHFDITELVEWNQKNSILLRLDNRVNHETPPDPGPFDYVKFSGLYRDVYLVTTDRVHITFPWESRNAGVRITTPVVKQNHATVDIKTTVRNSSDSDVACTLRSRIINADDLVVKTMERSVTIEAGREKTISQVNGLHEGLRLWSCDDPYLYRVVSEVLDAEGTRIDVQEHPLGFRTMELRENEGFFLNGKKLMLIGTNRHQHFPYIGDAVPKSLHRKDALQFKEAGFNVVRLAHYPHDNAFLEACDELGILVYEEGPTWINFGSAEWTRRLETALRIAIRNHRNHPSIFAWGAGINHRGPLNALHFAAKEEDPTRLTASNHSPWTGTQSADHTDFLSNMDYRDLGDPGEMMFASEHRISPDGTEAMAFVSKYRGDQKRFGMAAWTAHAYYTFHHKRPNQVNRTRGGMMDIFRIPKPVYHWYRSELTHEPMIYIVEAWTPETSKLTIFSNCDEVEVAINGHSLGRHRPDRDERYSHLTSPPFTVPVTWEKGDVTVTGFRQGEAVVAETIRTPEEAKRIEVEIDEKDRVVTADGSDIVMAYARVVDEHGTLVTSYEGAIEFILEGPGEIVGGPEIGANPFPATLGVAPVLLRTAETPETLTLTARSGSLEPGVTTCSPVVPPAPDVMERIRPFHDQPSMRIDIGGAGQHVQQEWHAWTGDEPEASSFRISRFSATASITLTGVGGSPLLWRGESNVPGYLGFMAEDGVCARDGVQLRLEGMPQGRYQLRSYHHAPEPDTDPMDPLKDKHYADNDSGQAAAHLTATVSNAARPVQPVRFIRQSMGSEIARTGPGRGDISFDSTDDGTIEIRFVPEGGSGTVWLNGLIIRKV